MTSSGSHRNSSDIFWFNLILVTRGHSWVLLDPINSEIMEVFFFASYCPPKSMINLFFRVLFFSPLVARQRKKKYNFVVFLSVLINAKFSSFSLYFFDVQTWLKYIISFMHMTKFNFSTRKIKKKKRKRKEDKLNTTSAPSESSRALHWNRRNHYLKTTTFQRPSKHFKDHLKEQRYTLQSEIYSIK